MPRHAKVVDRRVRVIRRSTVTVIWLGGLVAGFFGLLAAAARYGCTPQQTGFGCQPSGSILALVAVAAVIVVVAVVTVLTADRPARRVLTVGGVGFAALVACLTVAIVVLATA